MGIRVRYATQVSISSSTNEEKDIANASTAILDDSLIEAGSVKIKIAPLATDVAIQPSQVGNARFMFMRVYSVDPTLAPTPLNVKLNATGNTAIDVRPIGSQSEAVLLVTSPITAVYVSNPSATVEMYVQVYFAGT